MLILFIGQIAVSFFIVMIVIFVLFNGPPFIKAMFQLLMQEKAIDKKQKIADKKNTDDNWYYIIYKLKNGDDLCLLSKKSSVIAQEEYDLFKQKSKLSSDDFNYECFKDLTKEEFDPNKVYLKYLNSKDSRFHTYTNHFIIYSTND